MQVVNGFSDLPDDFRGLLFAQGLLLLQAFIEGSPVHVLEDDVEVGWVIEETVHSEDVSMIETGLDFDLEGQLVDHHV